jgi:uncharacterized protein (TIGR00255 family)
MTGHGEAHRQQNGVVVAVELRTINNRYFKIASRISEGYAALESKIEEFIRRHIRRGTVQVTVRVDRQATPDDYQLNRVVLASYYRQLKAIYEQLQADRPVQLESLLVLPGAVDQRAAENVDAETDWPLVEQTLAAAMESLSRMRVDEGRAMAADLKANCELVARDLTQIDARAPLVVDAYRGRLSERLNKMLAEFGVQVEAADIVREVGIFAERSDIAEEIVRLRSHLDQFDTIMALSESSGRKLEFLMQEMFRETNTIGSKSNDAEIARHVIEVKAAIERMREMIQNVE